MKHNNQLPNKLCKLLSEDSLIILLFHGVIDKQIDKVRNYTNKHIEKDLFAQCIKQLSDYGNPLSMDEVLFHLENKLPFPKHSFAITFDDGFENNLSVAAPILDEFNIPATIYVTSDFIDNNHMSWIDRIEYSVQNLAPSTFDFKWINQKILLDSNESRIEFLKQVRSFVKSEPSCNPNEFANELCYKLNKQLITKSNSQLDLKMSWNQVKLANQSKLLTIGGHSHTHVILSFLNQKELKHELDVSINMLYDKAGVSPTHYSYPEGLANCYNKEVINELKTRGVKCCPTAIFGVNNEKTSSFELKRIMI